MILRLGQSYGKAIRKKNMKSTFFSRILSLTLISALLLSTAACGKKNSGKSVKKISPDDPWFDAKVYSVEPGLDTHGKEIDFKGLHKLAGADDKYIVVFSSGNYINPSRFEEYSESDYRYFLATVIDRNTYELVNTIDYAQYISGNGYIQDVNYFNGKITSSVYMEDENGGKVVEMDNDVLTGKKLAERKPSNSYDSFGEKDLFRIGRYTILAEGAFDMGSSTSDYYYVLNIYTPEGEEYHIELKKDRTNLDYVPAILPLGEDRLLVPFTLTSKGVPVFFEVDIKESKAVEVDSKDYDWINIENISNVFTGNDGQAYFSDSVGISKIDMQNKKIEEVFRYSACPMNKTFLNDTQIIDCSDDRIVLLGRSDSHDSNSFETSSEVGINVCVITKASANPHAGKTILELYATYGYIDPTVAEAIIRFNETNENYFIEVTNRYKTDSVKSYSSNDSQDDMASEELQSNLSLNDNLAMDIMNGVGPDILIIKGDMGRLYNPNYLVDLSNYFGDLDSEKYFKNIIDAAKTDGKLYQLPVCFDIEGIHTDSKYAGASGQGFTPKEYEDFLYGPLNGYDLNQAGQAYYFTSLFTAMSDKFYVNGKVDFSVPEFAELADFVKNNVKEKAPTFEAEYSDERSAQNEKIARLTTYSLITLYLAGVNELQGANAILGIPSADGRGPMARSSLSVAVSAQSVNIDACAEFAKMLLSDEIQNELASNDRFTLSREAFTKAGSIILDYCNGPRGNSLFEGFTSTGEPVKRTIKFTEADITNLEKIISSCSHFDSADASINMILIEEMPAYFLGQKDLDSVIKIAQDRAQKVLDER